MLKTKSLPSDYTFHEFITVNHHCGFSSMHGDGKELSIDLCQQCFFSMCGDILTVIGPTYESSERLENHTRLRLAAQNILLAKKIVNKEEETIALKRLNVLWDAQHITAEPNELYQLMDLVFTYQGVSRGCYLNAKFISDFVKKLRSVMNYLNC